MDVRVGSGARAAATACAIAALALLGWRAGSVNGADGFTVEGEVSGLYPGARMTLAATITNRYPFPIRVQSVAVSVGDAAPGCPASMLQVGDSAGSVEVAPSETGIVPLIVQMELDAPDACQGATWPLAFAASATGPPTTNLPGTNLLDRTGPPPLVLLGTALAVLAIVTLARRRWRGSTA